MDEAKFREILEKAGMPANQMDYIVKKQKEDVAGPLSLIRLNYDPDLLLLLAKKAVAKGYQGKT